MRFNASMLFRSALVATAIAITPFAATLLATPAAAHQFKAGDLTLKHPWTRATPKGAMMGGGFVSIVNDGHAADRLIGGSLELAGRTEVHEMKMDGDVMKMRKLDGGLDIPAGGTVELKPGSFHLMFFDLKAPLEAGTKIKGTLVFEKAGTVPVEFAVEAIDARADDHKSGGHDAMPADGHGKPQTGNGG